MKHHRCRRMMAHPDSMWRPDGIRTSKDQLVSKESTHSTQATKNFVGMISCFVRVQVCCYRSAPQVGLSVCIRSSFRLFVWLTHKLDYMTGCVFVSVCLSVRLSILHALCIRSVCVWVCLPACLPFAYLFFFL